jgi:hypothetical protein
MQYNFPAQYCYINLPALGFLPGHASFAYFFLGFTSASSSANTGVGTGKGAAVTDTGVSGMSGAGLTVTLEKKEVGERGVLDAGDTMVDVGE